jgi:adenosylhomocysteine nucleosidase
MFVEILILAALPMEVRPFLRRVKARRCGKWSARTWEFAAGQGRGVAAVTGMGQSAGRAAKELLARYRPGVLVSVGFGGALTPDLVPGDMALGQSIRHFQPDTGELEEISTPAPPRPIAALIQGLARAGLSGVAGNLITTPYIMDKARQGQPLSHLPHAAVDLESSVLARLAAAQGLPWLGLRAITDGAEEEIPDFLRVEKTPGVLDALGWLARDPRRLKNLLHLRRRARLAAQRLAQVLEVLIPLLLPKEG